MTERVAKTDFRVATLSGATPPGTEGRRSLRLTKAQRTTLHGLFGGRCAYCGKPLVERWHADHIEPVERKLAAVDGRIVTTGEIHRPERDTLANLWPSCAPCNIDKHTLSLEGWRRKLQGACSVLTRNQPTYRHAVHFGLVRETAAPVVFYFERAFHTPARAGSVASAGSRALDDP